LIQSHNDDIVNNWIEAVRNDPRIHSDEDLTDQGLRNHIPFIIEEICNLLRARQIPQAADAREARVHVYTRSRQDSRARDLVCEISLMRMMLLDDLAAELLSMRKGGLKTYVEAARIINRFLVENIRSATEIYTEAEKQNQLPGGSKEK